MGSKASTGWGHGVPYAGWIVIDLRNTVVATIVAIIAEHDPACVVDHGNTRHVVAHREFVNNAAYDRLVAMGYRDCPIEKLARYPGGEDVLQVLSKDTWQDLICLRYERRFVDIEALIEEELVAFGHDPLNNPAVLGVATGPIPRPDNSMPQMSLLN